MHQGIHHISHADYIALPALSNSGIKELLQTPAHFKAHGKKETTAMKFGTEYHMALLEPERFEAECVIKPEGMKFTNKEGIAWREDHKHLRIISHSDHADIIAMRARVMGHPLARNIVTRAVAMEETYIWYEDGMMCKCRPDIRTDGPKLLADLKKCVDASDSGFEKAIGNFGYDIQAAWYLRGARAVLGNDAPKSFIFLAQEPTGSYEPAVYEASDDMLLDGTDGIEEAIEIYKNCMKSGNWPGYEPIIKKCNLPRWHQRRKQR